MDTQLSPPPQRRRSPEATSKASRPVDFDDSSSVASTSMSSTTKSLACRICKQGESLPVKPLIPCHFCRYKWHPHCHNPRIKEDHKKDWHCARCTKKYGDAMRNPPAVTGTRQTNDSLASAEPSGMKAKWICDKADCNNPIFQETKGPRRLCKKHEMEDRHKNAAAQIPGTSRIHVRHRPPKSYRQSTNEENTLQRKRKRTDSTSMDAPSVSSSSHLRREPQTAGVPVGASFGLSPASKGNPSDKSKAHASQEARNADEAVRTGGERPSTSTRPQPLTSPTPAERHPISEEPRNQTTAKPNGIASAPSKTRDIYSLAARAARIFQTSIEFEIAKIENDNWLLEKANGDVEKISKNNVPQATDSSRSHMLNSGRKIPETLETESSTPDYEPPPAHTPRPIFQEAPPIASLSHESSSPIIDTGKPFSVNLKAAKHSLFMERLEKERINNNVAQIASNISSEAEPQPRSEENKAEPTSTLRKKYRYIPGGASSGKRGGGKYVDEDGNEVSVEVAKGLNYAGLMQSNNSPMGDAEVSYVEAATRKPTEPKDQGMSAKARASPALTSISSSTTPDDDVLLHEALAGFDELLRPTSPLPDSLEAKRRQMANNYEPDNLDSFLKKQSVIEEVFDTSNDDLKNQLWGNIDPRTTWQKQYSDEWLAEKRLEIEARGGRKANCRKLLTAQVIKERRDKGWGIHQNKELVENENSAEAARALNELFGIEGIDDLEPGLRNGQFAMIEKPKTGDSPRKKRSGVLRAYMIR